MKNILCIDLYKKILVELMDEENLSHVSWINEKEIENLDQVMPEVEVLIGQPYFAIPKILNHFPNLKWVQITSAGYDAVDVTYLREHGIRLTNTRGVMSSSIAEDVILKMLFLSRNVRLFENSRKDHQWENYGWNQYMNQMHQDLLGKTLGILGNGSIAEEIAKRASGFDMEILVYGRHDKGNIPACAGFFSGEDGMAEIAAKSDYVVCALPGNEETRHLLDYDFFSKMKKSGYFINIARGMIVDEQGLIAAIEQKLIAGAGLDVVEVEPLPADSKLWELENVFVTFHKSGTGDSWVRKLGLIVKRNIACYLSSTENYQNEIKL